MKNVSHKKNCNQGSVKEHVEPPPIQWIKGKNDEKLDKDRVKNKLHRCPTSEKSDTYELKMALFYNGDPEEFLLFVRNFKMTLRVSVTLAAG